MSDLLGLQVEMWLVAPCDIHVPGTDIAIAQGERVLMEVSRKFTQARLRGLAYQAGWCWQVRCAQCSRCCPMCVLISNKLSICMLQPDLHLRGSHSDAVEHVQGRSACQQLVHLYRNDVG